MHCVPPGLSQVLRDARKSALPNGFRALVARQQNHPSTVLGQLGDSLEGGGAHRDELLVQSVDGAGAIGHQVRPMSGQHPQFGDQVIVGVQNRQMRSVLGSSWKPHVTAN